MKDLKDKIVVEGKQPNIFIRATYFFKANDKENMFTNKSAKEAHPEISKKFLDIIDKNVNEDQLKSARLDKQGYESKLEIGYVFGSGTGTPWGRNKDAQYVIDEIAKTSDNVFVEYRWDDTYMTN